MKTSGKILTILLAMAAMVACRKDNDPPADMSAPMEVRLVDAPSPYAYQEVNVDVRGVEVNIAPQSGNASWITLNAHAGIYNLLDLANGFEALIGDARVPAGELSQVRLILGENNSITLLSGQTYQLDVPSGSTSGLKLNVHEQLNGIGTFRLYLDFDVAHSIVNHGNGTFSLTPVLRAFTTESTGVVQGSVNIIGPGIIAILGNSSASYSTYADRTLGRFMLRGVAAGMYTLKVYAANSDVPVVVSDVQVTAGNTTNVGLILLGQ